MHGWWEEIIGLDNGMAPNGGQDITWTNDDPVQWRTYAGLVRDGLSLKWLMNELNRKDLMLLHKSKNTNY